MKFCKYSLLLCILSSFKTLLHFSLCTYNTSAVRRRNLQLIDFYELQGGPDSSVGTATRYGLDGRGIESRLGRDFPQPSRPALGSTQSPVHWVPGFFRG